MYKEFYIDKKSGTYAETLEAYGLAKLVNEVMVRRNIGGGKVIIYDKGLYYHIDTSVGINLGKLDNLKYFQVVKFLKNKHETKIPHGILESDIFNYPAQKAEQDRYKEEYTSIDKNSEFTIEQRIKAKKELAKKKLLKFGLSLDAEYDVYRQLISNPYPLYTKLYKNFYDNQSKFPLLINEIFTYYSGLPIPPRDFKLVEERPTAQQIFNPNQGKGLNKNKANNASMGNLKGHWVSETMKISGALSFMSVQYIKVGSSYDLKIYVPEFNNIQLSKASEIFKEFKRNIKSADPVKLDILNIIDFVSHFIKKSPEYREGKVRNTIQGFKMAYQKDLGQNRAIANIAYITTPDFIEYQTKKEEKEWLSILEELRSIISGIKEMGDSIKGLQNFRDFLGSSRMSTFSYFAKFSYWYAAFLMKSLEDEKFYVKPFQILTLIKLYKHMDTKEKKLISIIQTDGFQSVARAIRKSTVSLQYTPKDSRQFEIRYGIAQQLQNKSKSKEDLATFVGEFIGIYNAETARNAEKNGGKSIRSNVKDADLIEFYQILDEYPSRLVGALLASFGFALEKKKIDSDVAKNEAANKNKNIIA